MQIEPFRRFGISKNHLTAVVTRVSQRAFQRLMQAVLRERLLPPERIIQQEHGQAILPLVEEGDYLSFVRLEPGPMASW